MKWLGKHLTVFIVIALVIGLGFMAYPTLSNYWNVMHQTQAVVSYSENVAKMKEADRKKLLSKAKKYNEKLAVTGFLWHMTPAQKKIMSHN